MTYRRTPSGEVVTKRGDVSGQKKDPEDDFLAMGCLADRAGLCPGSADSCCCTWLLYTSFGIVSVKQWRRFLVMSWGTTCRGTKKFLTFQTVKQKKHAAKTFGSKIYLPPSILP